MYFCGKIYQMTKIKIGWFGSLYGTSSDQQVQSSELAEAEILIGRLCFLDGSMGHVMDRRQVGESSKLSVGRASIDTKLSLSVQGFIGLKNVSRNTFSVVAFLYQTKKNKNMVTVIFIVIIGLFALLAFWINAQNKHYNHFVEYAGEGDTCVFYLNEEKFRGVIVDYNPDTIYSYVKDELGTTHRVFSSQVYPVFGFNYKGGKR